MNNPGCVLSSLVFLLVHEFPKHFLYFQLQLSEINCAGITFQKLWVFLEGFTFVNMSGSNLCSFKHGFDGLWISKMFLYFQLKLFCNKFCWNNVLKTMRIFQRIYFCERPRFLFVFFKFRFAVLWISKTFLTVVTKIFLWYILLKIAFGTIFVTITHSSLSSLKSCFFFFFGSWIAEIFPIFSAKIFLRYILQEKCSKNYENFLKILLCGRPRDYIDEMLREIIF